MSTTQVVLNCHKCAFEWADACAERDMHLPSGKTPCKDCSRNPEREVKGTVDNYVSIEDMLLDEALLGIEQEASH